MARVPRMGSGAPYRGFAFWGAAFHGCAATLRFCRGTRGYICRSFGWGRTDLI